MEEEEELGETVPHPPQAHERTPALLFLLQIRCESSHPADSSPVRHFQHFIEQVLNPFSFLAAQVALSTFGTHQLPCAGILETFGRRFVGFNLRHQIPPHCTSEQSIDVPYFLVV